MECTLHVAQQTVTICVYIAVMVYSFTSLLRYTGCAGVGSGGIDATAGHAAIAGASHMSIMPQRS